MQTMDSLNNLFVKTQYAAPSSFKDYMVHFGLATPLRRAVVFSAGALALSYATKYPTCLYEADGSLRRFRGEDDYDTGDEVLLGLRPEIVLVPLAAGAFGYFFL